MDKQIIGLGSRARVGKDYAAEFLIKHYGEKNVAKIAFADQLKADLFTLVHQKTGVNTFTPSDRQKKLIRPLLVAYGEMMRGVRVNYWVEQAFARASVMDEPLIIVTDCRYPNEIDVLKKMGGVYFEIEADGVPFANESETKNSPLCRAMADVIVTNKFDDQFGKDLVYHLEKL